MSEDELLYIEQNARLVKNAEAYYRSMFSNKISSWNIRDIHMFETLDRLAEHIIKVSSNPAKIIVWAHNSHIGDARATQLSKERGELNLGQLIREKYSDKTFLLGFLTYNGTVTAASDWDAIAERKHIRPALINSYEGYLHNLDVAKFILNFKDKKLADLLPNQMLERAIGVVYHPHTERTSHYFYANLTKQFDSVIYLDHTHALKPLETTAIWHEGEVYETFPWGV